MRKSKINFLYLVIAILFIVLILREYYPNDYLGDSSEEESSDEQTKDRPININIINDRKPEIIQERKVIEEPKRHYDSRYYPRRAVRINVPTRGEPPDYQQVGILTDSNDPENIKPLYGRQTYRGSNQWNYFTSLDSHLATKIPIYTGEKDCTDERGCQEINKNDMLNIGDPGKQYKANIYKTHAPRYIPYI
jgi:hypothetical protein